MNNQVSEKIQADEAPPDFDFSMAELQEVKRRASAMAERLSLCPPFGLAAMTVQAYVDFGGAAIRLQELKEWQEWKGGRGEGG